MNGCNGNSCMFRNIFCFSWINKCLINNHPPLSIQRSVIMYHSCFYFFYGYMECRTCDPCHCPLLLGSTFLISELYHRAQVGIRPALPVLPEIDPGRLGEVLWVYGGMIQVHARLGN